MDADEPVERRPRYSERWGRHGWSLAFTTAGGRLRQDDPFEIVADAAECRRLERFVSQACFAIPECEVRPADPQIEAWASVARKILQRGRRPPVSANAQMVLGERLSASDGWRDPDALTRAIAGPTHAFDLADEYDLDPTYEQPLWDAVAELAPGLRRWLVPQAPLEALAAQVLPQDVAARWVDFVYAPPWNRGGAIIELDGAGHHRKEGIDQERDKAARKSRLKVHRYPGREALQPGSEFLRLLSAESRHMAVPVDPLALLALHGPATVTRLALAIVEAVRAGLLVAGEPWSLAVEDELGVAPDLFGAAVDPLRAISDVWGFGIVPDDIWVNGALWQIERGAATRRRKTVGSAPAATVQISLEPTAPYFARLPDAGATPSIVVRGVGVPVDLAWLPTTTTVRPRLAPGVDIEAPLTLLLRDLFGHDHFQVGQLPAIRRTLEGDDTVVLLPTGSGKSLIYQLSGLLLPGATLVIDPLISLIRDQSERLQRDSIERVAALYSSQTQSSDDRDEVLRSVSEGSALFAFLTPERLQIQRFRDHLSAAAQQQLIGLTVVDEAHCVSEWGHDFRTAYLRLATTLRLRCAAPDGSPPPVLALTGTASPPVLRDLLRELGMGEGRQDAIQTIPSHDRPNLHYRLVKTENPKLRDAVVKVLTEEVPAFHGVDLAHLVRPSGPDTRSGIVFTPHVNSDYGTERVAPALRSAFAKVGLKLEAVTYSGKPPKGFPRHQWEPLKAQAERSFKANEAVLLVGTKAFGMGIDKPNIRYTVHYGFPASVEAFAQEAGRAGRTRDEPAVCYLVAALPSRDQAAALLDLRISPEVRARRVKGVGKEGASDLSRQLFFLTKSYPGPEEETKRVTGAFEQLVGAGGVPGAVITLPKPSAWSKDSDADDRSDELLRSLYRLAMLGVVHDMTVDNDQVSVYLEDYTSGSIGTAWLDYVMKVQPGLGRDHELKLAAAPAALNERIAYLTEQLIAVVYSVVAASRLQALRFMYRLSSGSADPEHLRAEINAYLSRGEVAMVLTDAVTSDVRLVDVSRFVRAMDLIPIADQQHLVAETARHLEAYPDHPLLLVASALGEVRSTGGDEEAFASTTTRALQELTRYEVSPPERAVAVSWLARKISREQPGKRSWNRHVLRALYESEYDASVLEPIEDSILEDASAGEWEAVTLEMIRSRRLRRRSDEIHTMVDRVVPAQVRR